LCAIEAYTLANQDMEVLNDEEKEWINEERSWRHVVHGR
jgi:hypothetical protein